VAHALPGAADARLLAAAKEPRDRVALMLLIDYGIRRGGLMGLRLIDFDLIDKTVVVREKGQKERELPLRGRILVELERWMRFDLPAVGRPPEPDDFLLYPIRKLGRNAGTMRGYPKKPMAPNTIHRWWYDRCRAAGLVGEGITSGLNMHRARHSFAREMRRTAGIEAASQALGHADLSRTLNIYGHQDKSDLERAFEAFAKRHREEES
jgi:integrase